MPTTIVPYRNGPHPARCEGRLTAVSGDPVNAFNGYGQTLYFTPYKGNRISLLMDVVNNVWQEFAFSEISISNAGLGANDVRDVFIYWTETGLVLEFSQQWTGYVTRVDAIAYVDGVAVKASDHTRRLLGTIAAISAGHLTQPFYFFDTANARLISNLYNPIPKPCVTTDVNDVDDDALTEVQVTSNGTWVVPLYLGGEPNYNSWIACEPRMIHSVVHVGLRTSTATKIGCGIGLTPGDDNWDITTIVPAISTSEPEIHSEITWNFMTPIGMWISWQAYMAEGGDGKLYIQADDKRRGAAHDPLLNWMGGFIDC